MEVVKVQNRDGGTTKGAPRALRERVVHPRVKVTLLADLTLATTGTVPFTLSIAVAATIDPYFAFSPWRLWETLL